MKAVRIHRFGGPEVLQVDDIPLPEPSGGKVLIRVAAASVNPVDYKMRQGGFPRLKAEDLPVVIGRDVAGVIERGADGLPAGEEVYAHLGWEDGGYAEHVLADPGGVAPKPRSLDMAHAAAVPLAAATAWQGLFDHGGLKAGQRVLIHGGAGGVGEFAIQFAKAAGAHVAVTAGEADLAAVRQLGADQVIDYRRQRFEDAVSDLDLVFDLVGGETQTRSFDVLRPGGALVSTLTEPDAARAAAKHVRTAHYMAQPNAAQLVEIARLIDGGKVRVDLARTFPLSQAADAHRLLEGRHPPGKVVLLVA